MAIRWLERCRKRLNRYKLRVFSKCLSDHYIPEDTAFSTRDKANLEFFIFTSIWATFCEQSKD